jgi:hypothetical protein
MMLAAVLAVSAATAVAGETGAVRGRDAGYFVHHADQ